VKIVSWAAAVVAVLALAGCAGSTAHSAPPATTTPPATATSAPTPLACGTTLASGSTAQSDISALVQDQKSQDSSQEQNWVGLTDGSLTSQGQDLQNAASDFGPYSSGSSPLATDASQFATDAQTFMTDQGSGLLPGWVGEYRAIQHDIHNLAADCGLRYNLPAGE